MNQKQAQQLADRIAREDIRLRTQVQLKAEVGRNFWVVAVYALPSNNLLGNMEEPDDWDRLKQHLQNHR